MKKFSNKLPLIAKFYALLLLLPVSFISIAQKTGIWERYQVKERMTDKALHQKRNSTFSFSAKADDKGMNYEMSYSDVYKKVHTYRGQVAWEWTCQKGPAMLIPGEKVTIKGFISNLSGEQGGWVSATAVFGNLYFLKPLSGKSGDETAKPNGTATMIGAFTVPKQPALNRDGTQNPYIYLKFLLSGGNEQRFIERTITYKWTETAGQTQPPTPPTTDANAPQAWAEKAVYKVGEPIVVKIKNLPGFTSDWIGIYGAKAYHANEYIEWKHTKGLKEGSMQFTSPRYGAGDYVFRIYENNGYKLLVQTVAFKVMP